MEIRRGQGSRRQYVAPCVKATSAGECGGREGAAGSSSLLLFVRLPPFDAIEIERERERGGPSDSVKVQSSVMQCEIAACVCL